VLPTFSVIERHGLDTFVEGTVNKAELIDTVAERLGGGKRAADEAVEAVLDSITRAVAKGERVAITGFGAFEKVERAARTARNPRTGEQVRVKKTSVPKFKPGAEFKGVVSGAKKLPRLASTVARTTTGRGAAAAKATGGTTKTAAKSTARKGTSSRTTAAKKGTAAKSTARKTTARKGTTAAKKGTAARKTTARKGTTAAKKGTAAGKTTARKTTARKTTGRAPAARKTTARKATTAAKKAPARTSTPRKATKRT